MSDSAQKRREEAIMAVAQVLREMDELAVELSHGNTAAMDSLPDEQRQSIEESARRLEKGDELYRAEAEMIASEGIEGLSLWLRENGFK